MKRRTLLAGIGGLSVGGYFVWPAIQNTPVNESGIIPYLGDAITFTGNSNTSHEFEIEHHGPTIFEVENTSADRLLVEVINRRTGSIEPLVDFTGSETIRVFRPLSTSIYRLRIRGDSSGWSISIFDFDVHQPGDRQVSSLPVDLDGRHHYAVGPIHFDPVSDVRFVMDVENGGSHRVALYDEGGIFVNDVFDFQSSGAITEEFIVRLNGVGYLSIETLSEWSLSASHR